MKICKNCNIECDISGFYKTKNKSYPDSLLSWCKKCISKYRKERRIKAVKPEFCVIVKDITFSFD